MYITSINKKAKNVLYKWNLKLTVVEMIEHLSSFNWI